MSNANLTGASCPLILKKDGEEVEYEAVPLSDRDYESLDLWIQSQVIAITRTALQEQLEDEEISMAEFEAGMQSASRAAVGVSLYEASGSAITNTPKGAARIAYQMVRKNHSDVKYKDLLPYFRQIENFNEVFRVLAKLNPRDTSFDSEGNGQQGAE